MRLGIVAIGIGLLGLGATSRADGLRYDWRLEDGAEFDTNPSRAEHITGTVNAPIPPASPLTRLVVAGNLATPVGARNTLALSAALGGKWFTVDEARAANVLVVQASASDTLKLRDSTQASLAVSYYDVFQRRSTDLPDFRSAAPSLRLDQLFGHAVSVSAGAGYRWFAFKPDDAYSFRAPTASFALRQSLAGDVLDGGADWEWTAGGSVEARNFHGPACSATGCGAGSGPTLHHDRFWIGHAEIVRTGGFLLGLGAALHLNRSNSYGESLTRGLFHTRAVVLLPWQVSLSLLGELVVTHYRDPLTFLQPIVGLPSASIEDESRSTFRVELTRLFDGRFEVGARYVYYTNAPASGPVDYRRQTFLLYLAFLDER